MLEEESTKHHWLRIGAISLITFIVSFLAFYCAMELMVHRMTDPVFNSKRIEKIMRAQEKSFERFEDRMNANPFEPKTRPMMVNLVKENNEYKIIVDLTPLKGNENKINVKFNENVLTISGEMDKSDFGEEKILSFAQSYYLDEDVDILKMTKEKKGNKYIITIPFTEEK